MLLKEIPGGTSHPIPICVGCRKRPSEICMHGYTDVDPLLLCDECALLLARKLLEDLCNLRTLNGSTG